MSERYAFIDVEKASFPIVRGCKLLGHLTPGSVAVRVVAAIALTRA